MSTCLMAVLSLPLIKAISTGGVVNVLLICSFVRSTTMDRWKDSELDKMKVFSPILGGVYV